MFIREKYTYSHIYFCMFDYIDETLREVIYMHKYTDCAKE